MHTVSSPISVRRATASILVGAVALIASVVVETMLPGVHVRHAAAAPLPAMSLVADADPAPAGSVPAEFTVHDGWLYFRADDGVHGEELWRTNGTATELVADIRPGPGSGIDNVFTSVETDLLIDVNGAFP